MRKPELDFGGDGTTDLASDESCKKERKLSYIAEIVKSIGHSKLKTCSWCIYSNGPDPARSQNRQHRGLQVG